MLNEAIALLMHQLKQDGIEKTVVGAVIEMYPRAPLLLRRASDDFMGGCVELPSGTVEPTETLIDALKREIYEETGLRISSIDQLIDTFDYLSGSGKKTRQVNFKVSVLPETVILSPEHESFYTYSIDTDEYRQLNITPETRGTIEKAFA